MKKLLAVLFGVMIASPAFAAIQNVKVGGSITSYFVDRSDFDFDATSGSPGKYEQNFFYTSTHLLVSSDLSDNVSAQVGLANEVVWGDQNVENSTSGGGTISNASDQQVDLELANLTLREFLYSPLTLTIGRQTFSIGNDFLIGAGGGTSVGTMANVANDMSRTLNYDGIQAVLDYKPLTITGFYFKANSNYLPGLSGNTTFLAGENKDDSDLYGVVANYQLSDPWSSMVEGTFLLNRNNGANVAVGGKASTLYVPDLRVSTNPTKDLTLGAEAAGQFGNNYVSSATPDANTKRTKAWAAQADASYNLPVLEKYKPNVTERLSYYSGESNKRPDDKTQGWNALYNDQDLGTTIWRSLFTPSNLMLSELSFSVSPLEDVTTKLTWTDLWLVQSNNSGTMSLTLPDLTTVTEATKDKKNLGNELDGTVSYQYTEDVSFGLNLGIFTPGSVFSNKNNTSATEAIASVGVNF